MAEVKRGNGIPSLPLKNPPSFNHSSSSYKHIYDDVFASPIRSRQQSPTFIDDDYAEMFGSSRSNNGAWSISYSSIPVLDLPPPSEMRVRGASGVTTVSGGRGEVDYSGVFGGFGDGNFGLPDGEELFDQFNKKTKTSSNNVPRGKVQTMETTRPVTLRQSHNTRSPAKVFTSSSDTLQDFEDKKNVVMKNSGETAKASHARNFSVATHKMEETVAAQTTLSGKTSVVRDGTQLHKDVNLTKKQEKHDRVTSVDLSANIQSDNSGFHKESGYSVSNSVDTAHRISQPTHRSTNLVSHPSESTNHFDHLNKIFSKETGEAMCSIDVSAIHESTTKLHEVDPSQNNLSHETSALNEDTEVEMDVSTAEKQGRHSENTSSEYKASKRISERHTGLSTMSEPFSLDESQDVHQPNLEGGISKTGGDDFAVNFDVRRKKGRRSRITSLDLKDHKPSFERDEQLQRKPRFGSSYSFDASHDLQTAHVKVQPSMMAPSSSVPQFFPVESHYKISEKSTCRNFGADVYRGSTVSPPSFEEQLDMNSDAALSAIALQRAIEEATMIIQMAKEYLEREGQGSSNVRFKDTLKVKVEKVEEFADEIGNDIFRQIDTDDKKSPFLKEALKVKAEKDDQVVVSRFKETVVHEICTPVNSEKERYSLSERTSVLENGQASLLREELEKVSKEPVIQDEKNFVIVEGHIEESTMNDNSPPADSVKERFSISESKSVSENGEPSPTVKDHLIFQDRKSFIRDNGFIEERNPNMSNLIDERKESQYGEPSPTVKDHLIFQDRKSFIRDNGFIEERNPNMSNLIDERDKEEGGGEWEAAKHLNQLICGVKNKIASFMTWQSDTDKKEDPRETEARQRFQLQSEEIEPELVDVQKTVMKSAENNQDDIGCPGEDVEMEIGFLSETIEPLENESFGNNTVGLENADSSVDLDPNVALVNFVFCPFRNESVCVSADSDEQEYSRSQECMEIEFTSVREEMLNDMKYEQLPGNCEEQNPETLGDACTTLDGVEQEISNCEEQNPETLDDGVEQEISNCEQNLETLDDACTTLDSVEKEINANEIVQEPYCVAEKDINDLTDEEISNRSLDEEFREDLRNDSHCPEITTEKIDENDICEDFGVINETENWQHGVQILKETDLNGETGKIESDGTQTDLAEEVAGQMHGEIEFVTDETLTDHDEKIEEDVPEKASFIEIDKDGLVQTESSSIEVVSEDMAEDIELEHKTETEHVKTENEHTKTENEHIEFDHTNTESDHSKIGNEHIGFDHTNTESENIEDDCQQTDDVCFSESEGSCVIDDISVSMEEALSTDENHDMTTQIPNTSSDPKLKMEESLLFYDSFVELDEIIEDGDVKKTLQFENTVLHSNQSDVYLRKEEIVADKMKGDSEDIMGNRTKQVFESKETLDMGEGNTNNDQEVEKSGVESVQRRRRWFDNRVTVGPTVRPNILEGNITDMETDQEALDESVLSGSVEVHVDELDSGRQDVIYSKEPDIAVNQDIGSINLESTPKRRRWSVKIGEEGLPVPPPLFRCIDVKFEEPQKSVNEPLSHSKSESSLDKLNGGFGKSVDATMVDSAVDGEKDKKGVEATPRRKRWFGSGENVGLVSQLRNNEDAEINPNETEDEKHGSMPTVHEMEVESKKVEPMNDRHLDELNKKEKEKEKERIVVERAIREARERAFMEAKERARRDASERPNVDVRQNGAPGAQERVGKVPFEARASSDKASIDAKLRAERAAVERATSEARERALQKSVSEKAFHKSREQAGKFPGDKNTSSDSSFQNSSSSSRADLSNKGEKYDGFDSESAQRRKARLERQSRERPATVLEEKNRRDLLVQKEQAAKNMMADSLDAEVKRWSNGKEGNLRLLLSTLQHILGPESGWQAVSLIDLVAATSVRKAYKRATLCVHPDKLQQRGATIQQKYICEKVFELLKDALSRLNPDDR